MALAAAREERASKRAEEKIKAAEAAERARIEAEERAKREAEEAKLEAERAKREEADKLVQLLADQKAARDAKYAARKDRLKKGKRWDLFERLPYARGLPARAGDDIFGIAFDAATLWP